MKIAQCLEYPIQQHGGTEVLVRELILGLAERHEIVLVSDDDGESLRRSSVGTLVREHISWRPGATLEEARKLAAQLADKRIDIAHFHFGGTFGWGSRRWNFAPPIHLHRQGVPCLATNHGVFGLLDGYIGAQRALLIKLALLPVAWVTRLHLLAHLKAEVVVSMNDYHALRRRFWPQLGKFRQIYHSRLHEPPSPPLSERTNHIICVGTVGPRKGQTYLVEAFCQIAARHPEWKLVLIGRADDAAMMERIHSLRREHKLEERVVLLGKQSDAEVDRWLQTASIFAMPSLAEGLGLSLQEAQFHGCVCVGTRCGGVEDLIQDGDNGLLVDAGDSGQLADALERLITDPALREKLSRRAPQSVLEKGMTADKMIQRYEELYRIILDCRHPLSSAGHPDRSP